MFRSLVPGSPDENCEVLTLVRLRTLFDLAEGDLVRLDPPAAVGPPLDQCEREGDGSGSVRPAAVAPELDAFEGVVFDLDGTLFDLAVD